jgi:diketogulonate reductase-like aldo/keto reductase
MPLKARSETARLLDIAFNYEHEGPVGAAAHQPDVLREQIGVSSKLPGRHHAYDEAWFPLGRANSLLQGSIRNSA